MSAGRRAGGIIGLKATVDITCSALRWARPAQIQCKIGPHRPAKRQHTVETAGQAGLDRQFHRPPRHGLHGFVFIPERDDVVNLHIGRRRTLMLGDVDWRLGIAEDTHIHPQHTPAGLFDHPGKE